MNREELIEEAAKAIQSAHHPTTGAIPGWYSEEDAWRETYRAFSRSALAVFEKAQAPADDEREALARLMCEKEDSGSYSEDEGTCSWHFELADAVLAAGFRRPAQGEPTEKQVQAAIQGRYAAFRQNVHATETHLMRAALHAAFTAGQEEQS